MVIQTLEVFMGGWPAGSRELCAECASCENRGALKKKMNIPPMYQIRPVETTPRSFKCACCGKTVDPE